MLHYHEDTYVNVYILRSLNTAIRTLSVLIELGTQHTKMHDVLHLNVPSLWADYPPHY